MSTRFDDHGQPLDEGLNWERRRDRGFDELVGLCRGVLADKVVILDEARFLLDWLIRNEPVQKTYLGNKLMRGLTEVLTDGKMDHLEEDFVVDLLLHAVGPEPKSTGICSFSSQLPIDDPPPAIVIPQMAFCFTGKFRYGTRHDCEAAVQRLEGDVHKHPKSSTSYLVVGEVGSRDWVHSTSGRKIEHALLLKEDGKRIAIVSELCWVEAVGNPS